VRERLGVDALARPLLDPVIADRGRGCESFLEVARLEQVATRVGGRRRSCRRAQAASLRSRPWRCSPSSSTACPRRCCGRRTTAPQKRLGPMLSFAIRSRSISSSGSSFHRGAVRFRCSFFAVAGVASTLLRSCRQAFPRRPAGRNRGRARRVPRDTVLARRQRPCPVADPSTCPSCRAPEPASAGRLTSPSDRLLRARSALARRGPGRGGRARHRPAATDVSGSRRGAQACGLMCRAVQQRRSRLRRRAALACRAQPARHPEDVDGLRTPALWGFDRDEEQRLRTLPHVASPQALRLPRGRCLVHGVVLPAARVGILRWRLLSVLAARFAQR